MSLDRTAEESTVLGLAGRIGQWFGTHLEPATRRLAALDRRLVRVLRGSRLYGRLTADPDPDPVVIDLRETYTVGPLLAVLGRLVALVADTRAADGAGALAARVAAAPIRALGVVCCLGFAASLLGTVAGGGLTWPGHLFHALGLLAGVVMLRERRDPRALAESPVRGSLFDLFAPPPASDDER